MMSNKNMQVAMSLILLIGTVVSLALVTCGGVLYLLQHGSENRHMELLQSNHYHTSISQIVQNSLSQSPVSIIELGLLSLVGTQLLRVVLLVWFYVMTRDYWFTLISSFILLILVYSFFWRS
jgi:uncharacterized membrane protein